jgi:hypothetical protein
MLALARARGARKHTFLAAYTAIFAVAIAVDAYVNGPLTPVPKDTPWETAAGVVFVIVGDLRYFVAVERLVRGSFGRAALAAAIGWSLVVPIASEVLRRLIGNADIRFTFLGYELLFLALAVVWRAMILPRRLSGARDDVRRAAFSLTHFEIAQYAAWATADVVILGAGADAGYALRLAANLMYYALFVPFAFVQLRKIHE